MNNNTTAIHLNPQSEIPMLEQLAKGRFEIETRTPCRVPTRPAIVYNVEFSESQPAFAEIVDGSIITIRSNDGIDVTGIIEWHAWNRFSVLELSVAFNE